MYNSFDAETKGAIIYTMNILDWTHNPKTLNRIIFVLSLAGIVMAIYVLQSFIRQSSIVCLTNGCELVRKSPYSYPFGIPVPAFGLVGYTFLALLSFLRTLSENKNYLNIMFGISLFGVGFVSWFTYTELFIIGAICTWCAISAIVMVTIFILMIKTLKTQQSQNLHAMHAL